MRPWIGFRLAVVVATALAAAACGDSPVAPDNNAPYSQTDLLLGTGAEATAGAVVTVAYTGWYYNEAATDRKGVQFDSSTGRDPFSFQIGVGQVIAGWDQGVLGMRVGGQRRLVVPPSLAYGQVRFGPIPPNATLVFDIELLAVQTVQ